MSKSEPVLIPQWLKNSGSNNGGGTNRSGFFLRSDDQSGSKRGRTRSSVRSGEPDIRRSSTDQTKSPYLRRTSSSKDSINSKSYGSFNRSNRSREREEVNDLWDRDRTLQAERRHHEYSDHLGSLLPGKHNKDMLRHSQSMVSKVGGDSSNGSNTNGQLVPASSVNSNQVTFGQDFPSLVTEQRQGSDLSRASSPGFTGPVPSLSSVSSSTVSQDELENQEVVRIGRTDSFPSQVTVAANSAPFSQRVNGLNMAEAVVQGPSRAHTPPQLSVDTQRLQELAIKQSRQLIPIAPSMPRPLSPVEKPKPKLMQQQSQLHSNYLSNQTIRGGATGVDVGKASTIGKLQVLKSSRVLNGVSSAVKDISSPKNGVISPLTQTPGASATSAAPNKNPFSNQNPAPNERKPSMASTTLEKKTSLQAKSRNDFFNLIKKKASSSSQSSVETTNHYSVGEATATAEDGAKINSSGECCSDACDFVRDGKEEYSDFCVPPPDEEEAAFMRKLGWEEGSGEDESLTEEEINAFYESIKARPASELKGICFLRLNYGENSGASFSDPLSKF